MNEQTKDLNNANASEITDVEMQEQSQELSKDVTGTEVDDMAKVPEEDSGISDFESVETSSDDEDSEDSETNSSTDENKNEEPTESGKNLSEASEADTYEAGATKRRMTEIVTGGNRRAVAADAAKRAQEREAAQVEKDKALLAWEAIASVQRNQVPIEAEVISVREITQGNQSVICAIAMHNDYRIMIPCAEMYLDPPVKNATTVSDRKQRETRVMQKMLSSRVRIIVKNMHMDSRNRNDYFILGSRKEALLRDQKRAFGGKNPRIKILFDEDGKPIQFPLVEADIVAVSEHGVRVVVGGFETTIPIRLLSNRYIKNAMEAVDKNGEKLFVVGQKLPVNIRKIEFDQENPEKVASLTADAKSAELDRLVPNLRNLMEGDAVVATITTVGRSKKTGKPRVELFIKSYDAPAIATSVATDNLRGDIMSGTDVLFRVNRIDLDKKHAFGRIIRRN